MLAESQAQSPRNEVEVAFHTASCEFFNRVESLLRKVAKCSLRDPFFRLGERCLDGIWTRYRDLILKKFTQSQ